MKDTSKTIPIERDESFFADVIFFIFFYIFFLNYITSYKIIDQNIKIAKYIDDKKLSQLGDYQNK